MTVLDPPETRPELYEFLDLFLADEERGSVRSLDEYLRRFPGAEEDIAREYLVQMGEISAPPPGTSRGGSGAIPAVIGDYALEQEIGRGGQGRVFRAKDQRLPRQVAVKVLASGLFPSSRAIDRFRREAEAASRLEHPGIGTVYDAGCQDGLHWIAMRWVDGQSLAQHLQAACAEEGARGPVSLPQSSDDASSTTSPGSESSGKKGRIAAVLSFFADAADALHHAHELGVTHRDIKPANIMVTEAGDPVILDFGLARDTESTGPTLTESGDLMGTPAYMSPEQLTMSANALDRRTDVWSLGATLYEALTLSPPFVAPTRVALSDRIRNQEPSDPRGQLSELPPDLVTVLQVVLEKDRDRRYGTARDLALDLRRVIRREPVLARPPSVGLRVRRWAQRNPALAGSLLTLFIALAAGLGFALHSLDKQKELTADKENERARATKALTDLGPRKDLLDIRKLRERELELYPTHPDVEQDLAEWVESAHRVLSRQTTHADRLQALMEAAPEYTAEHRVEDLFHTPGLSKRESDLRGHLTGLLAQIRAGRGGSRTEDRLDHVLANLDDAAPDPTPSNPLGRRRTWYPDDLERQRDVEVHARLAEEMTSFATLVASAERRLAWARNVVQASLTDPAEAWKTAIASIGAAERYEGVDLTPQLGLLPLWENPKTGYWEFLHLETGAERPELDPATGRVTPKAGTGLVFVLLPGGTFVMGADKPDAKPVIETPNIDDEARPFDGPSHEVSIGPYFVSKFEMTQAQWLRLTGDNPSQLRVGRRIGTGVDGDGVDTYQVITPLNPVERITFEAATRLLRQLDLILPTEAQWEYAARGGTNTRWWFGNDETDLAASANIADGCFRRSPEMPPSMRAREKLDDGFAAHAPIGSFRMNPFGLHDVVGNVSEWCRDLYRGRRPYDQPFATLWPDGLRNDGARENRVLRGGGWDLTPGYGSSAFRGYSVPYNKSHRIGVRPVRRITP